MAIKRFKAYVSEEASGSRAVDSKVEGDKLEPRAQGEKDFKAKHSIETTKHPVAGDHQFNGDRAEITEEKYLNQKGTGESDDGYADAGLFDQSAATKLAKKHKGKAVKDAGGKFLVQLGEGKVKDQMIDDSEKMSKKDFIKKYGKENADDLYEDEDEDEDDEEESNLEESSLVEGAVVDQLKAIISKKSAKPVKFGNGKSEEIDMTTAAALVNMLEKLKPANKSKAEKMLEKSPEGMFQLLDVAFGGK
tara:strand:+ start:4042 stop:4785 length:744 start_codon:yes stop_codon:yes gene_type:complete